jgi:hypothetical protein
VNVLQEFDSKKRKIRSFRGFFLYALEIIGTGKDYQILSTNLQPFLWKKLKNIIRQNKKGALHEFLFGSPEAIESSYVGSNPYLAEQLASLEDSDYQNRISTSS